MNNRFVKGAWLLLGILIFSLCSNFVLAAVPPIGDGGWGHGDGGTTRVAEPAAILLLGTGLISLAIYARKKNGKK